MKGYVNFEEYMAALPKDRQLRINDKAKQLSQAIELFKLRKAAKLTQGDIAKVMGVSQARISKIENGDDTQLSTLCKYVQAVGGEVQIIAKMPHGDIVLM